MPADLPELELLAGLLQRRLRRLRESSPVVTAETLKVGRGLLRDLDARIDELLADIADVLEDIRTGDVADYEQHHLQLESLKFYVQRLHEFTRFFPSILRRDIPLGVSEIVHALIESVLGEHAVDALIHFDDRWMYSLRRIQPALRLRTPPVGPESVAVQLPGLEATSALLSPILAHEFGHIAVSKQNLVEAVVDSVDDAEWLRLQERYEQAPRDTTLQEIVRGNEQLVAWITEAICDAIATELTGPSMLLASAAFLPAPGRGVGVESIHPMTSDRIKLMVTHLNDCGWASIAAQRFPSIWTWLASMRGPQSPPGSNIGFFRDALAIMSG